MKSVKKWTMAAAALVTVVATATASGCGGGGGALDVDSPEEAVAAWAHVVCGENEPTGHYGGEAEVSSGHADVVGSAQCVREDLVGTFQQKRQLIYVFESDTAMETYLSSKECPAELGYLRVNGERWTATTFVEDLATDLVEAGGELCT